MDQQLVDLQIRYTHLERLVDELSQVVFEQQRQLTRMAKDIEGVRARLLGGSVGVGADVGGEAGARASARLGSSDSTDDATSDGNDAPHDEKPPHY